MSSLKVLRPQFPFTEVAEPWVLEGLEIEEGAIFQRAGFYYDREKDRAWHEFLHEGKWWSYEDNPAQFHFELDQLRTQELGLTEEIVSGLKKLFLPGGFLSKPKDKEAALLKKYLQKLCWGYQTLTEIRWIKQEWREHWLREKRGRQLPPAEAGGLGLE